MIIINNIEELRKITNDYNEVYIYGAGFLGKCAVEIFKERLNRTIEGFIVTEKHDEHSINGIQVLDIDEATNLFEKSESIVLICANKKNQLQIIGQLKRRSIYSYGVIDEGLILVEEPKLLYTGYDNLNGPIVLTYHRICDYKENFWKLAIDPSEFEKQIIILKEKYKIVPLEECLNSKDSNTISITFDDGYYDNYVFAVPILTKYSIPATFYISTYNINNKRWFWWDVLAHCTLYDYGARSIKYKGILYDLDNPINRQKCCMSIHADLKKMSADNREDILSKLFRFENYDYFPFNRTMTESEIKEIASNSLFEIGSHTKSHISLEYMRGADAFREIIDANDCLEEITGTTVRSFSYPYGDVGDSSIINNLSFETARTCKIGRVFDKVNPLFLPSVPIFPDTDITHLEMIVAKETYLRGVIL